MVKEAAELKMQLGAEIPLLREPLLPVKTKRLG